MLGAVKISVLQAVIADCPTEYPDIPSIPEEEEEEEVEQPASPLHFQEFSPGDMERSDAAQPDFVTALPWRGILKKTNSVK